MLCRENRNKTHMNFSSTSINYQLNCLFSPWFPNAVVTDSSLDCLHMTCDSITSQSIFQFASRLQRLHLTNMEFGPLVGVILFTPGNQLLNYVYTIIFHIRHICLRIVENYEISIASQYLAHIY